MKRLRTIERTVVLVSPKLTRRKLDTLRYAYEAYGHILKESVEYMYAKNISSWVRAKKELYEHFREKYPELPSHYVHEAVRDASARLKSFRKLKKKGVARTDKPVVKAWSVGCDSQMWKLTLQGVSIATHSGWVNIPLLFHKQFYKYYNDGWSIRSSCRWKLDGDKLKLYVVFSKDVKEAVRGEKIIGVDVNENNVTLFVLPDMRAVTLVTNHSKTVLGYAYRRKALQLRHSNNSRPLARALRRLRERCVKKDLRYKVASIVARVAVEESAMVVFERLPRMFQDRVLEKSQLRSLDVHRLKQSAIKGLQKVIAEKLSEKGVGVLFVIPAGTSSTCPLCGSTLALMTGSAQRSGWRPRVVKCINCGFTHDRDVVGAWNVALRALKLDVSRVPFGSKGTYDLRVEWLVATVNRGAKVQPVLEKPTKT